MTKLHEKWADELEQLVASKAESCLGKMEQISALTHTEPKVTTIAGLTVTVQEKTNKTKDQIQEETYGVNSSHVKNTIAATERFKQELIGKGIVECKVVPRKTWDLIVSSIPLIKFDTIDKDGNTPVNLSKVSEKVAQEDKKYNRFITEKLKHFNRIAIIIWSVLLAICILPNHNLLTWWQTLILVIVFLTICVEMTSSSLYIRMLIATFTTLSVITLSPGLTAIPFVLLFILYITKLVYALQVEKEADTMFPICSSVPDASDKLTYKAQIFSKISNSELVNLLWVEQLKGGKKGKVNNISSKDDKSYATARPTFLLKGNNDIEAILQKCYEMNLRPNLAISPTLIWVDPSSIQSSHLQPLGKNVVIEKQDCPSINERTAGIGIGYIEKDDDGPVAIIYSKGSEPKIETIFQSIKDKKIGNLV